MTMDAFRLIATPEELAPLLSRWRRESLLAIDTEAASFHRQIDRVYLLQLSTRSETFLIDPVAIPGLPGFGDLFADPAIEWVFHDADYDLRLIGHEFDFGVGTLFDTRVAAQFLNEPGIGLAALLEKYFGVRLDKQFQRADWSVRPLSRAMMDYAATDTRHLPALRDALRQRLGDMGRLAWVEEECRLLTQVRWPKPEPPEVAALSVKGARTLKSRALGVFRELYVWRTGLAERLDRAAFRIMGNEALFAIATDPPSSPAELARIRGVGKETAGRRGAEILAAVARGLAIPEADLPHFPRPPRYRHDPAFDSRLERLKAVRAGLSARLDLQPGVLAPNWLLEAIARAAPANPEALRAVEGIRTWQVEVIGSDLLGVIK